MFFLLKKHNYNIEKYFTLIKVDKILNIKAMPNYLTCTVVWLSGKPSADAVRCISPFLPVFCTTTIAFPENTWRSGFFRMMVSFRFPLSIPAIKPFPFIEKRIKWSASGTRLPSLSFTSTVTNERLES